MNLGHPVHLSDCANCIRDNLLREAAARRCAAEAIHARPMTGRLSCGIGDALVRAGEHLQGVRDRRAGVDMMYTSGSPQLARESGACQKGS
jgi:hypothetical protein